MLTPDPEEARAAVHGWLGEWLPEVIEPVAATGAQVRVSGLAGEILPVDAGATPDLVTPLRARFGD